MQLPARVEVCEVGPRDGLQNEAANVPTADKIRLIEALAQTGVRRMEATSFVAPKWIPKLADAGEVLAGIRRQPGVAYAALVPNIKGLERALAAKVDEAVIFLSASETHSQKNINKSSAEALETYLEVAARAKQAGLRLKGAISTCFGCPYAKGATGNVATEDLVHMLHEMGIETGMDLERLIECAKLAQDLVGRPLEGHVAKAGPVNHTRLVGA